MAHLFLALKMAAQMGWEMLWALILGFGLSALVQAVVSKEQMSRLLPDHSWRRILLACGLGAASSSCSYAAIALARSLFQKGADFIAVMAFQFASTNLVVELGFLLAVMMGWRFTLAEFVGGPLMIVLLVFLLRAFLTPQLLEIAKRQAGKGVAGRMEGHAAMDMSQHRGSLLQKATSAEGRTAISHFFVMDWASVWLDIVLGLLIAGAVEAWVPHSVWQRFFLVGHPVLSRFWGPLIGPLIAILSFVCSVGNVPLAAVLWQGGISFGGVVAFLFADLIVLPVLDIYRRYYGLKVTALLLCVFYAAISTSALLVEFLFLALHLTPHAHPSAAMEAGFQWNYTTWLNLTFLFPAALLGIQFVRSGGPAMLLSMNRGKHSAHEHHSR